VERVVPLALAVLAVFALATVAASLESVSTEPTIESETTPTGGADNASAGGSGASPPGTESGDRTTPADVAAEGGDESDTEVPLWQVAAGLAVFLVGSAVALYGLTRGEERDGGTDETPAPEPTAPAADSARLGADLPATNDVYRAWTALCRAVPLDPAGQTPAEVAEAAVAAGHEGESVAALTETFCAVRYGDAEPTGERERRARELAAGLSLPMEDEP
jgi:hypothetical protein